MASMSSETGNSRRPDCKVRSDLDNKDSDYLRLETKARRSLAIGDFAKAYELAKEMLHSNASRQPGYEVGATALRALGNHQKARRLDQKWQSKQITRDIMSLPTEVQLMIFEYLAVEDVLRATRVSKTWKEMLTSKPFGKLYTHLDIRRGSSVNAITRYIETCSRLSNGGIKSVILITPKFSRGTPGFESLIEHGQSLETLIIAPVYAEGPSSSVHLQQIKLLPRLTTLILAVPSLISSRDVLTIMESGPNLVNVDIRGVYRSRPTAGYSSQYTSSKLRRLRLRVERPGGGILLGGGGPSYLDRHVEGHISFRLPELRELCLEGGFPYDENVSTPSFQSFSKLESLSLIQVNIRSRAVSLPPTLRRLHLEKNWIEVESRIGVSFEALEDLTILENNRANAAPLDPHRLFATGDGQRTLLKKLCIGFREPMDSRDAMIFFSRPDLTELTDVDIMCAAFDDRCAEAMTRMNQLQKLQLRSSRHLTGVGIRKMVDSLRPKLREIKLIECDRVSPDAVAYCRAAGLKVVVSSQPTYNDGSRRLPRTYT